MKLQYLTIVLMIVACNCFASSQTKPIPDGEARDMIIRGSLSAFEGDCPCPYSETQDQVGNKIECGQNSAYTQSPGSIKCYPGDISDKELKAFREHFNIEEPKMPWDREKKPGY